MRLRLGFAVLWALMLHATVVLWWLSGSAPASGREPLAASESLPMVEVSLSSAPAQNPPAEAARPPTSVAASEDAALEAPAPRALSSAAQQQWAYEQRLRAYLAARANLAAQDALVGQAQLRFSVRADGVLGSVQVLQADSPAVAAAAVALLQNAAPLPRPPRLLHLQVPVQFHG